MTRVEVAAEINMMLESQGKCPEAPEHQVRELMVAVDALVASEVKRAVALSDAIALTCANERDVAVAQLRRAREALS
jgi:hypothetical protein